MQSRSSHINYTRPSFFKSWCRGFKSRPRYRPGISGPFLCPQAVAPPSAAVLCLASDVGHICREAPLSFSRAQATPSTPRKSESRQQRNPRPAPAGALPRCEHKSPSSCPHRSAREGTSAMRSIVFTTVRLVYQCQARSRGAREPERLATGNPCDQPVRSGLRAREPTRPRPRMRIDRVTYSASNEPTVRSSSGGRGGGCVPGRPKMSDSPKHCHYPRGTASGGDESVWMAAASRPTKAPLSLGSGLTAGTLHSWFGPECCGADRRKSAPSSERPCANDVVCMS